MSSDEMILLLIIYIFGIIVNICLFYQDIQLYGSSACLFCWPLSAITTVCATYVDYGDIHIPVGLSMYDTHKYVKATLAIVEEFIVSLSPITVLAS